MSLRAHPSAWSSPESPVRSYRHWLAKLISVKPGRDECDWRLSDIDVVDRVVTREVLRPWRQRYDDMALSVQQTIGKQHWPS